VTVLLASLPLLGACGGLGLALVGAGLGAGGRPAGEGVTQRRQPPAGGRPAGEGVTQPRRQPPAGGASAATARARRGRRRRRLVLAAAAGGAAWAASGWPVALPLAGLAVLGSEGLGRGEATTVTARLEAIASWSEMLRDTLAGAAGLNGAILATSEVAPAAIAEEVRELAARITAGVGLVSALVSFGEALADPAGDLVVAALVMAATERSQRLGELLGALAGTIRDEVALRLDIEASRASARTAVRTITGFSIGLLVLLAVVARGYLAPYRSPTGQLVLALVGGIFAVGLWLMAAMVRPKPFARLVLTGRVS